MRRATLRVASLAAVYALGACSGGDQTPTEPSLGKGPKPPPSPTECSFPTTSRLVGDVFQQPERRLVQDLLDQMQRAGSDDVRYDRGMSILAELAKAVNLGRQRGSLQTQEDLANNVIFCLPATAKTGLQLPITTFDKALNPSIDGAFEVRGGSADDDGPVVTRLDGSILALKPGVECKETDGDLVDNSWICSLGQRTLIYAFSTTPQAGSEQPVGQKPSFEWSTVPLVATLPNGNRTLLLGICEFSAKSLIQEDGGIIFFEDVAFLETGNGGPWGCPSQVTRARGWGLLDFARRVFAPEVAHAALVSPPGTGGLARGFSTFTVVDADTINLAFTTEPEDGTTHTDITVVVRATGDAFAPPNQTPVEGAVVELNVAGNSGSFTVTAPTCTGQPCKPSGITDVNGNASITFQIDKPGGYTLAATLKDIVGAEGTIRSYAETEVLSQLFNLQFP